MADSNHNWQEEGRQELEEQRQEQAEREAFEAEVPSSSYTRRQDAGGRKTVYIVQTCHWEYNDSFDEPCPSGGKAVAAFTTREKALRHLQELARQTGETLGIVEIYLENEEGTSHAPHTP